jgi:hypothetical protein
MSYLENLKVAFLPCDPAYVFEKKKKEYESFFDCIFISNSFAHRAADASKCLKPGGVLSLETAKYMFDLSKEQVSAFAKKEIEIATQAGLELLNPTETIQACDILSFGKKSI